MNRPSSTITAAAIAGAVAAILLGLVSIFWPDAYARIPPGFEAAVAVIFGAIIGYRKRENVLK